MNTEEKAKAYDKALEKARIYRDNAKAVEDYAAVARYENVFPELREEEKPLTPFQQCLNCILRGAYYAEVPDEKVNEFVLNVVRTRTDELIKLAKKNDYTDCQLHESENEKIIKQLQDYVKNRNWSLDGPTQAEVLAWLEKHKEQKPELVQHPPIIYTYPSGASRDERLKIALLALLNSDLIKVEGNKFTKQDLIEWVERIPTDKPAEWSEEDAGFLYEVMTMVQSRGGGG